MTPRFGGGGHETVLHPIVLIGLLVTVALIFTLPRRYVLVPTLTFSFLTPLGQEFYVAGVHWFVLRLLILAAYLRAVSSRVPREQQFAGGWNAIDAAFTTYVAVGTAATLMQYADRNALVNQVGYLWDYLLAYYALRSLIRNRADAFLTIKCFAALMIILATGMVVEQIKMVNLFGLLGGVRDIPELRESKIRSQGVFQHSLTAGAFAAGALPLFFILWKNASAKILAITGIAGATIMTITTQTSTSLLCYCGGIGAALCWPLREKMKSIRRGLLLVIIGLHLVMKAPVWFVIARIDLTGSSSSYHRAALIDQCVQHFSSWWLIGTKEAATWGWDMWDAQNMYVSVGEGGGVVALIFYILVISRTLGVLGTARKHAASKKEEHLMWFLGSAVFANVVAFFGVNYFDQVRNAWFALIAMVCACACATGTSRKGIRTVPTEEVADVQHSECAVRSEYFG